MTEIPAVIQEQFDPKAIVRLIRRCDSIEDAMEVLKAYGEYRAINARSEGFKEGLDSSMASLDKILEAQRSPAETETPL